MYTLHYTIQNDQCDYTGRLRDENIFVYFSRLATADGRDFDSCRASDFKKR